MSEYGTSEVEMTDRDETMEAANLFVTFRRALAYHQGKAVFTIGGVVEPKRPLTIRWDSGAGGGDDDDPGAGLKVKLPVPDDAASRESFARLVRDCEPATFGRREEEVFDEEYRKAGKMDTDRFCTDFNPYEHSIVDVVHQSLARVVHTKHRGLRAELYKLNVYSSPSGRFKAHVDTPRSEEQMGSLVVCLPYLHSGGELAVRHGGREIIHDWGPASGSSSIQWAAFFSDCEHEVLPVTDGHRVTLTYNLFWSRNGPCAMAADNKVMNHYTLPFYKPLRDLLFCPGFFPKGGIVGFTCTHAYPHTSNAAKRDLAAGLKGLDMAMYQSLKRLGGAVRVTAVLDDSDWAKWVHDNGYGEDSGSDDEDEDGDGDVDGMKWATSKVFLADRPRSPFVWEDYGDGEDQPPDPQSIGTSHSVPGRFELAYTPWFPQTRVAWLNHEPTYDESNEFAAAYLTYGNQPGMGTYYSSAVIVAELTPFPEDEDEKPKGDEAEKPKEDKDENPKADA